MVHDLDLACVLAKSEPVKIEAAAVHVFSDSPDIATAVLTFESGAICSLAASRATQDKVRRIALCEKERYIVADCLRQDVSIKREATVEYPTSEPNTYRQANVVEIPYLDRSGEPLTLELLDFVAAVREKRQTDGRWPSRSARGAHRSCRRAGSGDRLAAVPRVLGPASLASLCTASCVRQMPAM